MIRQALKMAAESAYGFIRYGLYAYWFEWTPAERQQARELRRAERRPRN